MRTGDRIPKSQRMGPETLLDRCKAFMRDYALKRDAPRVSSPADALLEFVLCEAGRYDAAKVGGNYEQASAVVLYFETEKDREEFIEAVSECAGLTAHAVPRTQ